MAQTSSPAQPFETRLYWMHARSPLHVGAGRGVGFVDLPIMREAVTNWPFVPGSAVKGVLADYHDVTEQSRKTDRLHGLAFGQGGDEASNSGSLVFTDAHLICLPVRSLYGTFAWCTSPIVLERLRRDLRAADLDPGLPQLSIPAPSNASLPVHVSSDPASALADQTKVYFEDLDFQAVPCDAATQWAKALASAIFVEATWQGLFRSRFAVVPDDVFNFLCETATQIDARVKIDDNTKTVADGQLWYEESLPAETVLAGIAWCGPVFGNANRHDADARRQLLNKFCTGQADLQIGGKATVGRGQVCLSFRKASDGPAGGST